VWRPTDPDNVYFLTKQLHKEGNKSSQFTKGGKEDEVNLMLLIKMYSIKDKEILPKKIKEQEIFLDKNM
jgi:hypothetical protein